MSAYPIRAHTALGRLLNNIYTYDFFYDKNIRNKNKNFQKINWFFCKMKPLNKRKEFLKKENSGINTNGFILFAESFCEDNIVVKAIVFAIS